MELPSPDDVGPDLRPGRAVGLGRFARRPPPLQVPPRVPLPDDTESGSGSPMVELPSSEDGLEAVQPCGCARGCTLQFDAGPLRKELHEFQMKFHAMTSRDRANTMFALLRSLCPADESAPMVWKVLGRDTCKIGFRNLLKVGRKYVDRILASVKAGALEPPGDGRALPRPRNSPAFQHVSGFLEWIYWNIAEPLADVREKPGEDSDGFILP